MHLLRALERRGADLRGPRPAAGDSGASDKRRLIIEAEFAQILKVLAREGNTLSPVVRNAWDGKPLQTIAKNAPVRATGAHIAIIGHITKDELLRFVSGTELANGFVNRFLLVAVRRSQELPFGGRLDGTELERVRDATLAALRFASLPRQLTFDAEATGAVDRGLRAAVRGEEGLLGAATRRAEAHVVRLAAIYATLDTSRADRRCRTSKPRSPSGATASTPPAGSSATRSATRPPTRSGRSPKTAPTASPAARSATSSAATRKPARSTAPSPSSKKPDASPAPASTDGRGRPAEIWRPQAA